jgi:hypothetical protein
MKVSTEELLEDRGGHTGNYSCPVHISVEACKALFEEVGVTPTPKAVGTLGDILENFAIAMLRGFDGTTMSPSQVASGLRNALGEAG